MAELYKFFNSIVGDERWHYASDFAEYFGDVLTTGLLDKASAGYDNCQVTAVDGKLQIAIGSGKALMQGYSYTNTSELILDPKLPDTVYDRIDRVVIRLDKTNANRYIKAFIIEGLPSSNPTPPSLTRNDYVYEISLAQVRVKANLLYVDQNSIIDERTNQDLCGFTSSKIAVPTSVFQQQWNILMDDQKSEFLAWFAELEGILSDDVAGNLLNLINANKRTIDDHIADEFSHNISVSTKREAKDENGTFTVVKTYRKSNGNLYQESVLSGGTSPKYTTRTVMTYKPDGTTIARISNFANIYDADDDLMNEDLIDEVIT